MFAHWKESDNKTRYNMKKQTKVMPHKKQKYTIEPVIMKTHISKIIKIKLCFLNNYVLFMSERKISDNES